MVFSSVLFLFRFMPVAFILYYLTPRKLKNLALVILSLVFYSWGEVRYFPIMIFSVVLDYTASRGIERNAGNPRRRKLYLLLSMAGNLGMLMFFKYTNFIVANVNALTGLGLGGVNFPLPLGISFYTFQTMSYTIDVYRGDAKAERNIINFASFVVLFPQLIAGPIVRYLDISRELRERRHTLGQVQEGIAVFITGLGKKVLIANSCGALWREVEALGFATLSTPMAWLGLLGFSLQIYFDFSGYSLMAIGLGKMLGFEFPQNFNYPYIARSITDFWRRWHMTLGTWFRDYVYIPMGGNRVTPGRQVWNLFVVWGLTGLWHGASWNFVLWGLYFFVLLVVEKFLIAKTLKAHRILSHIYLIFTVMFSWSLFAITDFSQLTLFWSKLFGAAGGQDWAYYLRNYGIVLALGVILSTPVLKRLDEAVRGRAGNWPRTVFLLVVLLLSVAYLVDASYNPFLYFRF